MENFHFTEPELGLMARPKRSIPAYLKHSSGSARVLWNGDEILVGPYGSAESYARYQSILDLFRETGSIRPPTDPVKVGELIEKFLSAMEQEYGKSKEPKQMRLAFRVLRQVYGELPSSEFSPFNLRGLRDIWVKNDLSVTTINMWHSYVVKLFKWASSHDIVEPDVTAKLASVSKLSRVRGNAKPPKKVLPVSRSHLESIREKVSRQVWAMMEIQWHTGMRPGEVVIMRGADIDTSGEIWKYRPSQHKTMHRGKDRIIGIGPHGQEVLREMLRPGFLFSPQEALCEMGRTPNMKAKKVPGQHYTEASYGRAVREACKKAGVEVWSPNRIRHAFATRVRSELGLDSAQVALGHSDAKITQIYAEKDMSLIEKVAKTLG
ncbi:XerC Integrase [uncultured Caudovirales phage]|uniref:Integrase n=1 Tax=uncultured Caudovirales phage TaxID=2100421 RepID=A0A6J7XL24_9CAUD|nr:XerC Integrase [uncultured Caudovirales phage]